MIIKVCGMCDPENIRRTEKLAIDWLGFVFYAGSKRFVRESDDTKAALYQCMKPKVGVFVNEFLDVMLAKAEMYRLSHLQLHGNETPEICRTLKMSGYHVLKAFSIALASDFEQTSRYADWCDYFLFDTKCTEYGGSGKRFDWSLLDAYNGDTPFILSGGLTPESLDDIRRLKHPMFAGIDLNSGFEVSPGVKDVERIGKFVRMVRELDVIENRAYAIRPYEIENRAYAIRPYEIENRAYAIRPYERLKTEN